MKRKKYDNYPAWSLPSVLISVGIMYVVSTIFFQEELLLWYWEGYQWVMFVFGIFYFESNM